MEEPGGLQSRGCKESDTTERLHFLSFFMSTMEYYATIKTCEVHNKEDKSHTHGTEQRKPQTTVYVL